MASFIPTDLPTTQVLVRTRDAIQVYNGPVKPNASSIDATLNSADLYKGIHGLRICPIFSPHGDIVCYVFENKPISLCNTASGDEILSISICDAEYVEFSPLGTFLVSWSRPSKAGENSNMRIWEVSTGSMICSFSQKIYKSQVVQWTADEEHCFRLVSNEVQIFSKSNMISPVNKVYHKGLTQFHVTSTTSPYISVAVFNPEAGGKPARVSLYRYSPNASTEKAACIEGPVSSRTIFAASEAKLTWNATGSALLVYAHADTDASSYYGATGLFLLQAHSDSAIKVEQSKDGPVHDVQWSPEGDKFVVAAGTMPCHCTLMDSTGAPLYQYGAAHRNTISWSPHGRFLCLAGFGNLAGEMDFYDTLRSKKIGSASSHCATYHAWSPDSRYFLTASLAPRMNVDNNLKVFKYNGAGPVVQIPFDRAYDVRWRPAARNVYPNRGPSPKRGGESADAAPSAAKPAIAAVQPYRPPGSTGALAKLLNKESAPVGKVSKVGAAANATTGGKFTPSVQRQRIIPGMAPPGANPAAGKKSNALGAAASSVDKKKPNPAPTAKKEPAPAPIPAAVVVAVDPNSTESKEKRAKNINKKLKAIEELRVKQKAGQALEPEQIQKLNTETQLLAELKSLSL